MTPRAQIFRLALDVLRSLAARVRSQATSSGDRRVAETSLLRLLPHADDETCEQLLRRYGEAEARR